MRRHSAPGEHLPGVTHGGFVQVSKQGLEVMVVPSNRASITAARDDVVDRVRIDDAKVAPLGWRFVRTTIAVHVAAYKMPDDTLLVTAHQSLVYVDLEERKALLVPDDYRAKVVELEGDDVEH